MYNMIYMCINLNIFNVQYYNIHNFKTALYSIHNTEQTLQGTKLQDKRVGSEEK